MLSNDKNVEAIAQLVEVLKHYIGFQSEYMKLDVIEKVVRLLTVITITIVFCTILLISLIYLSFAVAFALQTLVGSLIWAFLIVGGSYLLLLFFFILPRRSLIECPLIRFLESLLMSK